MKRAFQIIKKIFREAEEKLKKHPLAYAAIGAVGIVLFWRGIWHTFDFIFLFFFIDGAEEAHYFYLLDGLVSSALGFVMLMSTGLFFYDFVGAKIISSELKTEEKIVEKTEREEKTEEERLDELESRIDEVVEHIDEHLENIERKLGSNRE